MLTSIELFAGVAGFSSSHIQPVAFVEIEPNCRAVLRRHHPGALILEDVRTSGQHNLPWANVIKGGWPCQDVSVAGLRAGLAGKRSGLFYEYIRIVSEMKPDYFVWENVPGLLSSNNGKDMQIVMQEIAKLGYNADINILNAQNFGVAQRRRRIFAVCERVSHLLQRKTPTSAQTILQWMLEILLIILVEARAEYSIECGDLVSKSALSADGLMRRISLFGITNRKDWDGLLINLEEVFRSLPNEPESWVYHSSEQRNGDTIAVDISKSVHSTEGNGRLFGRISRLWSDIWDDQYVSPNSSIISTALRQTTESIISICAEISSSICWRIVHLKNYFPNFSDLALFALTVRGAYTSYARQAVNWLFTEVQWLRYYHDYLAADRGRFRDVFGRDIGATRCAEILSLIPGVSGYSPAGGKARANVAATIRGGAAGNGTNRPGRRGDDDLNIVATLGASFGRNRGLGQENEIDTLVIPFDTAQITSNVNRTRAEPGLPASTLNGSGQMHVAVSEPQTFDWQAGVAKDDRAWLVDKPGRTRALTSSRTLAVFGGNDTSGERSVAASLTAHPTGRYDFESENLVCGAQSAAHGGADDNSGQANHLVVGALSAHSKAHGHAMTTQQAAESGHVVAAILNSGGNNGGFRTEPGEHLVLAFSEHGREGGSQVETQNDIAYALRDQTKGGASVSRIAGGFGVRRLTPRETERLQGFEDDWTAWGIDESGQRIEMSDSARYRMTGNAVCRAVSAWLDRRIAEHGYD